MTGFTRVPNFVLDRLLSELDPYTFKVYLHIIRCTTGWNRTACQISLSQFQNATGIAKRNVVVASLKELEERRLISSSKSERVTTSYQLVTTGYHPLVTASYQPPVTPSYPLKERQIQEWEEAKVRLATSMSKSNYSTYIRDLQLLQLTDTELVLSAPSAQVAEWVESRFVPLIRKSLGRAVTVSVQVIRGDSQALMG